MKVLLGLLGLVALLFAGMHAVSLVGAFLAGDVAGVFGPTRLLGHVVAGAVGLPVAVLCFRKCAADPVAGAADFKD